MRYYAKIADEFIWLFHVFFLSPDLSSLHQLYKKRRCLARKNTAAERSDLIFL
jgi:hypothetical protein